MTRRIIAFTGPRQSGKSTAAAAFVARGAERRRFAGPLKAMLQCLGLTPAQIDGELKEVPCDLLAGKTPRYAMQTLGTEWGRGLITPELWINAWWATLPIEGVVVVDDCRFPNEADAIRSLDGLLIRIERPGCNFTEAHESEAHELEVDAVVQNDCSLTLFTRRVLELVAEPCPLPPMPTPARCTRSALGSFDPGCTCAYCSWTLCYLHHKHYEAHCFDPGCPASA